VKQYALVLMTLMSLLTAGCESLRSVEPAAAPEPAATPKPAAVPEPVAPPEPAAAPEPATAPEPAATFEPSLRADSRRPVSDNESLLTYFEFVRKLSAAELAKEHETARQLYTRTHSDFNRVRYAMLLSVPGSAFNDDARALEALEPLLKNLGAALHNLAFVVSAQIQEQRRSQELQQKLDALMSLEKSLIERGQKP
jgi:hypothetical protein